MKIAQITAKGATHSVTFHWSDGQTSSFDLTECPEAIRAQFEAQGAATKLGNAYAGKGPLGVAKCREATLAMWDQVKGGDWEKRETGGVWIEAAARAMKQPVETVRAAWAKMDDAQRAKIKRHPDVAQAKIDIDRETLGDEIEPIDLSDFVATVEE